MSTVKPVQLNPGYVWRLLSGNYENMIGNKRRSSFDAENVLLWIRI